MKSFKEKKLTHNSSPKDDTRQSLLFDTTHGHGMCMLDDTGRILSWNAIAERLFGYTSEEVVGKNYFIFFTKEDTQGRRIFKKGLVIAAKKGRFVGEGIRVRKDKSRFWARSFITPVKEGVSGSMLFVLIVQDITKEKTREQKRDEYIGVASHELKSPITTLSLYSELLAKRLELSRDKKNLHMLHDMQSQTTRLVVLIDDLLTVSKIETDRLDLHKEVFNPDTLVKKVIRDFQHTTRTHKILFQGALRHEVRADKDRITQVLINLLTNAVKYSPLADHVLVRVARQKNKCVISSQDFGPGVTKKDQHRIFSRFFRGDDAEAGDIAGSGLGLYISKEIIKRHREKLWMKSIEGKGTTFSFTLPLV